MIVSEEAAASRVGLDILKRGGNAVDAAVAVGFALAVTLPRAGNLGGGGFMVVHLARQAKPVAIDYRETAPAATRSDTFLNEKGDADPNKSLNSGLAVGVPGTVAGLALAHARYGSGKFSFAELIAPAIRMARAGAGRPSRHSSGRMARHSSSATRWCSPILPPRFRQSRTEDRRRSTKGRWRKRSLRRSVPPAVE